MQQVPDATAAASGRHAADVTRRHQDERERAVQEIAQRNHEAHEAALKRRLARDAVRDAMRQGLSF